MTQNNANSLQDVSKGGYKRLSHRYLHPVLLDASFKAGQYGASRAFDLQLIEVKNLKEPLYYRNKPDEKRFHTQVEVLFILAFYAWSYESQKPWSDHVTKTRFFETLQELIGTGSHDVIEKHFRYSMRFDSFIAEL